MAYKQIQLDYHVALEGCIFKDPEPIVKSATVQLFREICKLRGTLE
jgi:hypothetical protein